MDYSRSIGKSFYIGTKEKMDIQERILKIFNQNRKNPNDEFIEDYFLTYLIPNPSQNHNLGFINNSFKGNNRHHNFLEDIQIEFGICFSNKDKDRNYKLEEFIERVTNLLSNKKASKAALTFRFKHMFHSSSFIYQNIVLLLFALLLWKINVFFKIIAVLIILIFNLGAIYFYQKERKYLTKLKEKILVKN